jgi:hypothetical protein
MTVARLPGRAAGVPHNGREPAEPAFFPGTDGVLHLACSPVSGVGFRAGPFRAMAVRHDQSEDPVYTISGASAPAPVTPD